MSTVTFQALAGTDWQAAVASLGLTVLQRARSGAHVTVPFEEHVVSPQQGAHVATLEAAGCLGVQWLPDAAGASQRIAAIATARDARMNAAGASTHRTTNGRGQTIDEPVANYERAAANKAMHRLLAAADDDAARDVANDYAGKSGVQLMGAE